MYSHFVSIKSSVASGQAVGETETTRFSCNGNSIIKHECSKGQETTLEKLKALPDNDENQELIKLLIMK